MSLETQEGAVLPGMIRRWVRWFDRRRQPRVCRRPLGLWVEGHVYETLDWSASGARINAARTALVVGDFLAGTIEAIGSEGPGQFTAEVVRLDAAGEIGFRFIEVSALTLLAMQGLGAS